MPLIMLYMGREALCFGAVRPSVRMCMRASVRGLTEAFSDQLASTSRSRLVGLDDAVAS